MMNNIELLQQDLTSQINMVRQGRISASELAQLQLDWIKKVNDKINAFISINDELPAQSENKGQLAGVAIAVKDNVDVAGFATTAGLEVLRDNHVSKDAFVVSKLRIAGGSFSGKLNMHEGALGASNHNAHFGNCYNPHDLTRTPGGSSGGSGASVAAGMAALSLGSDTMGSVRIPASYCGVFGFKATRGAISNSGSVPCSRIMDNIGPIARSARDLSLAFEIMQGYDIENAESKALNFAKDEKQRPILLIPDNLSELGIDEDVIEDFEANLQAFKDIGCQIKPFSFADYNFGAARRAGLVVCEADMRLYHADAWQNRNEDFSPYLRSLLTYIDSKTPMDVMQAELALEKAVLKARKLFAQGDFLLMPTAPQRAFTMDAQVPANQADLTGFANQAGLCAVSLPMLTEHKLPAGMQIVGAPCSDRQVLALAEKWQQHTEFSYQIPSTITSLF